MITCHEVWWLTAASMIVLMSGMRTLLGSSRFLIKSTSVMRPSVRCIEQCAMCNIEVQGQGGKVEKEIKEMRWKAEKERGSDRIRGRGRGTGWKSKIKDRGECLLIRPLWCNGKEMDGMGREGKLQSEWEIMLMSRDAKSKGSAFFLPGHQGSSRL